MTYELPQAETAGHGTSSRYSRECGAATTTPSSWSFRRSAGAWWPRRVGFLGTVRTRATRSRRPCFRRSARRPLRGRRPNWHLAPPYRGQRRLMRARSRRRKPEAWHRRLLPDFQADGHRMLKGVGDPYPDEVCERCSSSRCCVSAGGAAGGPRQVYVLRDMEEHVVGGGRAGDGAYAERGENSAAPGPSGADDAGAAPLHDEAGARGSSVRAGEYVVVSPA